MGMLVLRSYRPLTVCGKVPFVALMVKAARLQVGSVLTMLTEYVPFEGHTGNVLR